MAVGLPALIDALRARSLCPEEQILADQDSNLDKQNQNLLCYRYTIAQRPPTDSRRRFERSAGIAALRRKSPGERECKQLVVGAGTAYLL